MHFIDYESVLALAAHIQMMNLRFIATGNFPKIILLVSDGAGTRPWSEFI